MKESLPSVESDRFAKIETMLQELRNPLRLEIVALLAKKDKMTVLEIHEHLGIKHGVTSGHLIGMRNKGLLKSVRNWREMEYSLATPKLLDLLEILKKCFPESRKK